MLGSDIITDCVRSEETQSLIQKQRELSLSLAEGREYYELQVTAKSGVLVFTVPRIQETCLCYPSGGAKYNVLGLVDLARRLDRLGLTTARY